MVKAQRDRGRPSSYDEAVANEICRRLAEGEPLRAICRADDMPSESTVRGWVLDDRDGFSAQYAKAREIGYHSMADELLEIADDGTNDWMEREGKDGNVAYVTNSEAMGRSRLRVDTRKWLLSKCLPKIYGDKVAVEHDVSDNLAQVMKEVDGRTRGIPGIPGR